MKRRTLTFDFDSFGKHLLQIPKSTAEELRRARQAHALLGALAGTGGPTLDAQYMMGLPEEVFQDAQDIVTGEPTDAASRAIVESVDEDEWPRLRAKFEGLSGIPDPTVAPEFI